MSMHDDRLAQNLNHQEKIETVPNPPGIPWVRCSEIAHESGS